MNRLAFHFAALANLVCLGLALVLWLLPLPPPTMPASATRPASARLEMVQADLGSLPDRSLFRSSIEPRPDEPPAPPPATMRESAPEKAAIGLRLIGIVEGSQGRVAFVKLGTVRDLQRRVAGDAIEDWFLVRIDHRSIEIRKGHEVKTVALDPGSPP